MSITQPLKKVARRIIPLSLRVARHKLKQPLLDGTPTYSQDGLLTIHNSDFMRDPRFIEAYRAGEATRSWRGFPVHWRAHVAFWAADLVKSLPGDFVECGVNRGGFSRAIISYVDFSSLDKTFWLVDTFRGLDESLISDEEAQRGIAPGLAGGYSECYDDVCRTFAPFNARIIRGLVPDVLPQVLAEKVCYLSIDMNCVAPEIAAAQWFWDKMVPGAVMLLDDYGWTTHIAQKHAFDAFAREKNVPLLSLPTGQGLIIKPRT